MVEHGAYTLLLDRYYASEVPIPADQAHRLARARSKEERAAVDAVLTEFFELTEKGWRHGRVEKEILSAQSRIDAAKKNGTKGGRPRKTTTSETQEKPSGFSLGSENETQPKAPQAPSSIPQAPIDQEQGQKSVAAQAPPLTLTEPPAAAPTKQKRATRIPDNWQPTAEDLRIAAEERPDVDALRELVKFRDHFLSAPGQKGVKANWSATFRNWIRNAFMHPHARGSPASITDRVRKSAEDFGNYDFRNGNA